MYSKYETFSEKFQKKALQKKIPNVLFFSSLMYKTNFLLENQYFRKEKCELYLNLW